MEKCSKTVWGQAALDKNNLLQDSTDAVTQKQESLLLTTGNHITAPWQP